mgnify:CR=1 FL=1
MSASREKKSRQESLAGGYVDPRTKREKDEQAKDRRSNALYIAIAVIFVIVGIVVTVANSKVIERNADAVTIGNETYTAADVSYFYNTIYSSFVSKNSYYLSAYGLDTSKSLKEQDCPVTDGGTWYDYFRDQALESLKSYALLAQKAEAEGFDGSEEVEQSVQDTFADLDAAAASAGYTRAQYIKAVCGPLVNEKVFERNVRLEALAQAYSADHVNSLEYSDDEIQAAYDADPKSFQSADIEYILFSSGAGDDATDEEKAELLEQAKQKAETALSRYAQGEAFDAIGEDMEGSYAHVAYAANGSSDMLTWAFDDARQEGDTTIAAYGEKGYYAVPAAATTITRFPCVISLLTARRRPTSSCSSTTTARRPRTPSPRWPSPTPPTPAAPATAACTPTSTRVRWSPLSRTGASIPRARAATRASSSPATAIT